MEGKPCTYRISIKAVITDDDGRVLLLREADGGWELPGGGLEHGEDPQTALAREIAEETGHTAEWVSDRPVGFWTIYKEVGSPTLKWFAVVAYEAKVSGELQTGISDEAHEAGYFSPEEAQKLMLHDNTKPYFGLEA